MTKGHWRGYVVACALIAFICAWLAYTAFSVNSWGKWHKSQLLVSCWSLPPPFGCADLVNTRDVLNHRETDFAIICLFCFVLYLYVAVMSMGLLASPENSKVFGMERMTAVISILRSFILSVVFSTIACLIASYRLNAVHQAHLNDCVYDVGGFQPVYSTSFYLVIAMAVLAVIGSLVVTLVSSEDYDYSPQQPSQPVNSDGTQSNEAPSPWSEWNPLKLGWKPSMHKPKGTSRTTKQHIARNLLYPEDQQLNKMITFSSMPPEMEEVAADICMKTVMRYTLEEDIAEHVKLTFEDHFGPSWQCAVGDSFGSCVHHMANEYVEVALPKFSVLLYRCNEPAEPTQNQAEAGTSSTPVQTR